MPTPSSSDPNQTSGRGSRSFSSYSYPLNENLTNRTVISFKEYERWTPQSSGQEKTTSIIHLPLPTTVPDNIQLKYGGTDTDFIFNNYDKIKDTLSGMTQADIVSTLQDAFTDTTKKDVIRAAALASGSVGRSLGFGDQLSLIGGVVKNPHTTSMFDGVTNRVFNLTWRFSPRSQQESDTLNSIVNKIRESILPEESFQGFALDYPDLAYIDFEGPIKQYLPQIYRSFITAMNVSTTNGDSIIMYSSSAPVTVELNLSFAETNIVTRKTLREGRV